jgi:hypothetical protein
VEWVGAESPRKGRSMKRRALTDANADAFYANAEWSKFEKKLV